MLAVQTGRGMKEREVKRRRQRVRREWLMKEEVRSGRVRPCGAVRARKREKRRGCRRAATKSRPNARERCNGERPSAIVVPRGGRAGYCAYCEVLDNKRRRCRCPGWRCWLLACCCWCWFSAAATHSPARPASCVCWPAPANQTRRRAKPGQPDPGQPNPLLARPRLHTPFHAAATRSSSAPEWPH